jgi:hypothetical protein
MLKSFIIFQALFSEYYWSCHIKEDGIDGTWSTHVEMIRTYSNLVAVPGENNMLGSPGHG